MLPHKTVQLLLQVGEIIERDTWQWVFLSLPPPILVTHEENESRALVVIFTIEFTFSDLCFIIPWPRNYYHLYTLNYQKYVLHKTIIYKPYIWIKNFDRIRWNKNSGLYIFRACIHWAEVPPTRRAPLSAHDMQIMESMYFKLSKTILHILSHVMKQNWNTDFE